MIKKVALLHSLCSVGKASLTNMIPVLSTMGVEVCPIPTVMLSTHTGGYGIPARQAVDANYIRACADHYRANDITFDAIFVGYLGCVNMTSSVQYFLEQFPEALVILDPIMGDHGKLYSGLTPDYATEFLSLCSYANIIVPNLTEASLLTGIAYDENNTKDYLELLCNALHNTGVEHVIITGIPSADGKKGIALSSNLELELLFLEGEPADFHGTGDVFDAVLTGEYMQGAPLKECIMKAHEFARRCIQESIAACKPEREGIQLESNLSRLV